MITESRWGFFHSFHWDKFWRNISNDVFMVVKWGNFQQQCRNYFSNILKFDLFVNFREGVNGKFRIENWDLLRGYDWPWGWFHDDNWVNTNNELGIELLGFFGIVFSRSSLRTGKWQVFVFFIEFVKRRFNNINQLCEMLIKKIVEKQFTGENFDTFLWIGKQIVFYLSKNLLTVHD